MTAASRDRLATQDPAAAEERIARAAALLPADPTAARALLTDAAALLEAGRGVAVPVATIERLGLSAVDADAAEIATAAFRAAQRLHIEAGDAPGAARCQGALEHLDGEPHAGDDREDLATELALLRALREHRFRGGGPEPWPALVARRARLEVGRRHAAARGRPPASAVLERAFGLDSASVALLGAAAACALDPALARDLRRDEGILAGRGPGLEFLFTLLSPSLTGLDLAAALLPGAPLRTEGLVEVVPNPRRARAPQHAMLIVDPQVISFLSGERPLAPEVAPRAAWIEPPPEPLAWQRINGISVGELAARLEGGWQGPVVLAGPPGVGKRSLAAWLAARIGRRLLALDLADPSGASLDVGAVLQRAAREAHLRGGSLAVVVDRFPDPALREMLDRIPGHGRGPLFVLLTDAAFARDLAAGVALELATLGLVAQARHVERVLARRGIREIDEEHLAAALDSRGASPAQVEDAARTAAEAGARRPEAVPRASAAKPPSPPVLPGTEERLRLWSRLLPTGEVQGRLPVEALARVLLEHGAIPRAIARAAFAVAARGDRLRPLDLWTAAVCRCHPILPPPDEPARHHALQHALDEAARLLAAPRPGDVDLFCEIATAEAARGRPAIARARFEQALRAAREPLDLLRRFALFSDESLGDPAGARAALERYLEHRPGDRGAWLRLADLAVRGGRPGHALDAIARADALPPDDGPEEALRDPLRDAEPTLLDDALRFRALADITRGTTERVVRPLALLRARALTGLGEHRELAACLDYLAEQPHLGEEEAVELELRRAMLQGKTVRRPAARARASSGDEPGEAGTVGVGLAAIEDLHARAGSCVQALKQGALTVDLAGERRERLALVAAAVWSRCGAVAREVQALLGRPLAAAVRLPPPGPWVPALPNATGAATGAATAAGGPGVPPAAWVGPAWLRDLLRVLARDDEREGFELHRALPPDEAALGRLVSSARAAGLSPPELEAAAALWLLGAIDAPPLPEEGANRRALAEQVLLRLELVGRGVLAAWLARFFPLLPGRGRPSGAVGVD